MNVSVDEEPSIDEVPDELLDKFLQRDDLPEELKKLPKEELKQQLAAFLTSKPSKRAVRPRRPVSYVVDTHPLLREHFAAELRGGSNKAWTAAHRRLYEYLTESTEYQPDTLEGLQPLYQAVAHGCQAVMHQEVCYKVYIERILRGLHTEGGFYSVNKLGAYGSDLAAVASFFERPWTDISRKLSEALQAWLLNEAGTRLRALGRLTEALEPTRVGLQIELDREDWNNASIRSGNLSEMELTLGRMDNALTYGKMILTFLDKSDEWGIHHMYRSSYADALHQAGQRDKAAEQFRQVEAIQAEHQPKYPMLYSTRGFRYCDLLLAPAEYAAWQNLLQLKTKDSERKTAIVTCHTVKQRTRETLQWITGRLGLHHEALGFLSLGQASLYEAIISESEILEAKSEIEKAVTVLRQAAHNELIVRGLLRNYLKTDNRESLRYHNNAQASLIRPR